MIKKVNWNIDGKATAEYNIYDEFSWLIIMFGLLGYFNIEVKSIFQGGCQNERCV